MSVSTAQKNDILNLALEGHGKEMIPYVMHAFLQYIQALVPHWRLDFRTWLSSNGPLMYLLKEEQLPLWNLAATLISLQGPKLSMLGTRRDMLYGWDVGMLVGFQDIASACWVLGFYPCTLKTLGLSPSTPRS